MYFAVLVAPFAGAWIEISIDVKYVRTTIVAPFAGAWIEIDKHLNKLIDMRSHPSRVRGLKYRAFGYDRKSQVVAPFAGAWIEMCFCR